MNVVHRNTTLSPTTTVVVDDPYGYGDAAPDVAAKASYGYGDDVNNGHHHHKHGKRGHYHNDRRQQQPQQQQPHRPHQVVPDTDDYGYGDATPDRRTDQDEEEPAVVYNYNDDNDDAKHAPPCHRTVTPRRSSLKSGSSGHLRRNSITNRGEIEVPCGPRHQSGTGDGRPRKTIRRRVSIGYSEEVKVQTVEPVPQLVTQAAQRRGGNDSDGGAEGLDQLWFQEADYRLFKKKNKKIVQLVKEEHKTEYCTRGLERLLDRKGYQDRQFSAWFAVMEEQELQRKRANSEDSSYEDYAQNLAVRYRQETAARDSERAAAERAHADAQDAQRFTKDVRQQFQRMSRRMSC